MKLKYKPILDTKQKAHGLDIKDGIYYFENH